MGSEIVVSVICNTYNHEKYIRQALDSFLNQHTEFPFEVLIHDDASTDCTQEIIHEYEEKNPTLIKPIYQTENQYSKGVRVSSTYQYPRVKGKYIAICEGDDYWTDPFKLQRQVQIMESNPNINLCAHAASKIAADSGKVLQKIAPFPKDRIITAEQMILGEGGMIATSSILYRASLNQSVPRFRREFPIDYTLQIHGSLRDGVYYLHQNMSVYRWMSAGSWTERTQMKRSSRDNLLYRKQRMLDILNEETEGNYHTIIELRKNMNKVLFHYREGEYRKALSWDYKKAYWRLGIGTSVKIIALGLFPGLGKIKERFSPSGRL